MVGKLVPLVAFVGGLLIAFVRSPRSSCVAFYHKRWEIRPEKVSKEVLSVHAE